ncbi:MAG: hypothetical protein U0353_12730 [Sandaracinus sp.]|jgi:tetratricopeptide (TPR) repeat protein
MLARLLSVVVALQLAALAWGLESKALAQSGSASAGSSEFAITSGSDEEARAVFVAGRDAYARGEYDQALLAFRQAYELSGRGELQFNIGQTADRLRHDREARDAFEAYLAAVPDAANRVEVESRLRVLREEIARDDALRAQASGSAPHEDAPIVEQWWFWTLIGVAVVGAGVGIGFAVGSHDELAPPTPGDFGPDGYVIALEGL